MAQDRIRGKFAKGNKVAVGNKGGGRKSVADDDKFIEILLDVAKKTLKPKHMYQFQDRMILGLINDRLKPHGLLLSTTTFVNWKKMWIEDRTQSFFTKRPALVVFFELWEKLLREAQGYLLDKLEKSNPGHWQKYAWILERRFATWQLDSSKQAQVVQVIQLNVAPPEDVPLITSEKQMLEQYGDAEDIDYEEM